MIFFVSGEMPLVVKIKQENTSMDNAPGRIDHPELARYQSIIKPLEIKVEKTSFNERSTKKPRYCTQQ